MNMSLLPPLWYTVECTTKNERQNHRVIILNRGSMFAFQWREFSPPLSSAHRLLQCYHSQWEIGDAANPPQPPTTIGPLANERAVSSDVILWRCTFWSGNLHQFLVILLWRHALSSGIMTLWTKCISLRTMKYILSSNLLNRKCNTMLVISKRVLNYMVRGYCEHCENRRKLAPTA